MNGPLWITNSNPLVTHLKTLKDSLLESRDLQSMKASQTFITYGVAYRTLEQSKDYISLPIVLPSRGGAPDYREIKRCDVMSGNMPDDPIWTLFYNRYNDVLQKNIIIDY